MKQTGKLLPRNRDGGSKVAPHPSTGISRDHVDSSMYDPLSENFVVPPGIRPTPLGLALFFVRELRKQYDDAGRRRTSMFDYRAYLRPAKTLLRDVGFENAVRTIVYATRVANHTPSFKFVLKCAERFQQCPETGSLI